MHPLLRSACRITLLVALALTASWPAWTHACAQSAEGTIRGEIGDPSSALIPGAHVSLLQGSQIVQSTLSNELGEFVFRQVAAGKYSIDVTASGFREETRQTVVGAAETVSLVIRLKIEIQRQQVSVAGEDLSSSPDRNLGAVILRGSDLDALATNPQDLKQQLEAMAGSDVSPQFYVDGFTTSHLPPKSSILEVHMNQDPYSAEFETPGAERIEIITKPGSDKLHGNLALFGELSQLNSRNPYVASQPSYTDFYSQGDISGRLSKSSSWFLTDAQQNSDTQSFIHAVTSSTGPVFTQTVFSPQLAGEVAPRIDFQAGKLQTFSIRYDLDRESQDNLVQSQFSLPSQAVDTRHDEQTLQITDSQAYTPKLMNMTRFQFMHTNDRLLARSGAASVLVQGAFNGGGNNFGQSHDGQNHYELQDYVSLLAGNHLLHFGGRLRDTQDGNTSTGGYNGEFIFSSIEAYETTQQGIAHGLSPAQIRALGGGASEFTITAGGPKIAVNVADGGLFFEDQWKLNANMTLTPGLRYETQSRIHDRSDFAPRLSYGWSIGPKNGKPAKVVLRAGAGLFFQRFTSDLVLNAARQNGVLQQQFVVQNPDFFPNLPPPNAFGPATLPTIYRIAPRLDAPRLLQISTGVERQFGARLVLSADYTHYRGTDLLLTRNINAPLPGSFDPADPASGTRPLGTLQNIYEYESEGVSKRNELLVNMRYTTRPVMLYGYYVLGKRDTDAQGASTFPSNQYDLHQDYGRAINDLRNRAYMGGIINLPRQLVLSPFLILQSSQPFNITVGQDLNGDSQFNDRPAFATDLGRPSVFRTRWGNFDADPLPGQKIIPINYGTGPSMVMLNMGFSRNLSFGPKLPEQPALVKAAPGKKVAPQPIARRFQTSLGLEAQNIFNHVNGGPPVGVLGSSLFGQSTSLSPTQFSNAQGNRILYLHMTLTF